jgi:hypothetical protein
VRAGPLRVANCSGFFGDRLSAAKEMVEGGPIDVLTGDWLAELTMYILHKTRARSGGYAGTFLRQLEEVLPACIERGIKVVSNAGGLDPAGAAEAVRELARRQGVDVRVASVAGDDLVARLADLRRDGQRFVNQETGEELPADAQVVTANAYLGAAPIAAALSAGADVVVTGRVTDASLVVGPTVWAFGWGPDDLDQLAGAVVAGHVIECGAQCCGGNYAFFEEVPGMARVGFPLAELSADGTAVITKHPGTGGAVTVGTVTAQLLYEIGGPRYLSPDAVARFDTIALAQVGPDRVRISGTTGEPPPPDLKVTANLAGGWRNAVTFVLSGGEVEEKAALAEAALWEAVPGGASSFAETAVELLGDRSGANEAFLRIAVRGEDERTVGRAFSAAAVETALASFPGAFYTGPPSGAQEVARYWPTTVPAQLVRPEVVLDGQPLAVEHRWAARRTVAGVATSTGPSADSSADRARRHRNGARRTVPLGVVVGARSGDKGGLANVGFWADADDLYDWVLDELDTQLFRSVLPEVGDLDVDRHVLANLRAVNFVVHGILGHGVASNLRLDAQGKALGELARARRVAVPAGLVESGAAAARIAVWDRHAERKVN